MINEHKLNEFTLMELDTIYNMDCLEGMKQIPDGTIDAVIQKHEDELIITNFDIDVVATCKGRAMQ